MCTVATFNPWVYSKCSMENLPVQFSSASPWSDPVTAGASLAGIANGAGDGTVVWAQDGGCRLQPFDVEATLGQQRDPISEK